MPPRGCQPEARGPLIVIERETGLEQIAESGVMIHGDLSADLLRTIFSPRSPLHDGAVIVRGARILAAGAVLPLSETTIQSERFGTRHRAALGTTEQTDAIVVVVSEETGHVSYVHRARIVRNLNEGQLARALRSLLEPNPERARLRLPGGGSGSGTYRLPDFGRAVRTARRDGASRVEPMPADEPMLSEPPTDEAAAPAPAATGPADESTDTEPVDCRNGGRDTPRSMTRLLNFVLHNWPLKLAAVGLATLLYGGLVLSQTTETSLAMSGQSANLSRAT